MPTDKEVADAKAILASAEQETQSNAGPVVEQPVGDAPAASAPNPGNATGDEPAASAPEVEAAVADVEQEAQAVKEAVEKPSVESVVTAAEPVVSALDALASQKSENPHASFAEHLKALADKGLAAVLDPADESAILGALVQVIKEVVA